VGIDDWSWRKAWNYGTIVVDLERRQVVDVLPDRTMIGTANWLKRHPEVEIVNRDGCGLYAQGRHRRGRSPTAFISCKICGSQSKPSSVAQIVQPVALCCPMPIATTKSARPFRAPNARWRRNGRLPGRRIAAQGKPSLTRSAPCATGECLSTTLLDRPVSVGAVLQMAQVRCTSGPTPSRSATEFAPLFPGVSIATLERRCIPRSRSVRRDQTSRLHRQLLEPGAASDHVATRQRCEKRHCSLGAHDCSAIGPDPRLGSRDRPCDIADRRCCTLHEAARVADSRASGKGRCPEKSVARFRRNAHPCPALPGHSPEQRCFEAGRLAGRCI
jgi:hypothetical protein